MLEVNRVYSFSTLVPSILGLEYKGMRVESILNYKEASKIKDIFNEYSTIRAMLSPLPAITSMVFYKFRDVEDNILLLPLEYIDGFSVKKDTIQTLTITITGEDNSKIISSRFKELGITKFDIEVKDNKTIITIIDTTGHMMSVVIDRLKELGITNFTVEIK